MSCTRWIMETSTNARLKYTLRNMNMNIKCFQRCFKILLYNACFRDLIPGTAVVRYILLLWLGIFTAVVRNLLLLWLGI